MPTKLLISWQVIERGMQLDFTRTVLKKIIVHKVGNKIVTKKFSFLKFKKSNFNATSSKS